MCEALALLASINDDTSTVADRVATVAPIINKLIEDHESEQSTDGVQTFQDNLCKLMAQSGTSYHRTIDVDVMGCHPHNRERTGLVPIDVHDLLDFISSQGWNWAECDRSMCCEIPPTTIGTEW